MAIRRRVWLQTSGGDGTQLRWREADNSPPAAQCISSLDAGDAHSARKSTTPWVGDNVHLTATGEEDAPQRIPPAAGAAPPTSPAALPPRGVRPGTPIVAPGCLDAARRVRSPERYEVDLWGPTRLDEHGQARAGAGFEAQPCPRAGDRQHAICPAGKTRLSGTPAGDNRGQAVITGTFSPQDCRPCPT